MTNKNTFSLGLIICLVVIIYFFLTPIISLKKELKVNQNDIIEKEDFLEKITLGKLLNAKDKVSTLLVGEKKINLQVKSILGLVKNYQVTLIVKENPNIISKKYDIKEVNGVTTINGVIIVNKSYSLPSDYGNGLTTDTLKAFQEMQNAAKEENLNLFIRSGFRSYLDQTIVYDKWVKKDGQEVADTYSARPGYSEHQTGLAMDLNSIDQDFADTKEFAWLNENAYKYGFILRYPQEKEEITGYIYEPWHYRYVGVELSKELYNNGNWLTLEEYFEIDSKY